MLATQLSNTEQSIFIWKKPFFFNIWQIHAFTVSENRSRSELSAYSVLSTF